MANLDNAVTSTLSRLGDLANAVWARSEIALYYKDGYDTYCRRTKALFDTYVIENLPPVGNWQTDFEKYLALQHAGWGVTDMPFHFTNDGTSERELGVASQSGQNLIGPSGLTSPSDRQYVDTVDGGLSEVPTTVKGGVLPQATVEVVRVAWNSRNLTGLSSQQMRQLDPTYEIRVGDPQYYLWDKDGLYTMRFVPAASGDADYATISGGFGTLTQLTEIGSTANSDLRAILGAYWDMEEETGTGVRRDSLGVYDLTPAASATRITGINGFGVQSSNTGGKEMTSAIPIGSPTSWSISAWVKNSAVTGQGNCYGTFTNNTPYVTVAVGSGSHFAINTDLALTNGTKTISPNVWYHTALTFDGSTTYKLYVNGVLDATATRAAATPAISLYQVNGSTYIDEMAFWNDALTASQALALYNGGTGLFYDDIQGITTASVVTTDVNGFNTRGFGILAFLDSFGNSDTSMFPSGGPWGTPTQIHPDQNNFRIEVFRLGRDLDAYDNELPTAYQKYVTFYAMAQALRRDGPGQDIELADHYESRFEMGVNRLWHKIQDMQPERVGRFGGGPAPETLTLGRPILPYPYDTRQW